MADERVDAYQSLINDVMQDPELREHLKRDPRGTLGSRFGAEFPEGLEIEVLEETASKSYVVIPASAGSEGELSDAELSQVAGGSGKSTWVDTAIDCWQSKGTSC